MRISDWSSDVCSSDLTSAAWFDSLPADLQKIMREEALKAGDQASRATEDSLIDFEKQMAAKGMTVTTIDVAPFREAKAGVYDKLGSNELRAERDKFLTDGGRAERRPRSEERGVGKEGVSGG